MKKLSLHKPNLKPLVEKKESKEEAPKEDESKGLSKDVFLYMEPKGDTKNFAQCGTCKLFMAGKNKCSILGDTEVLATDSCGLYVNGTPSDTQEVTSTLTSEEVGLVHTEVRCENCEYFEKGDNDCLLYRLLNIKDYKVNPKGCCNAFSKR